MNEIEKLQRAKSLVEAAQSLLAEAGRELFSTDQEKERAAIWKEHEKIKTLWHKLGARGGALRRQLERRSTSRPFAEAGAAERTVA